jgi:hypothetical protein
MNPDRFTVTAIVTFYETEKRYLLGFTNDIDKAREIAAQDGARHYPLYSTCTMFDLEILDTVTGQKLNADAAEAEARDIARSMPTVADVGYW